MKRITKLFALGLTLVVALALGACDSDSGDGGGTTTPTGNDKADKQAFSGTISGDDAPGEVSNEQADAAANTFAAGIAGNVMTLWLVPDADAAYMITVVITTDDSTKLPGTFSVGPSMDTPVFVTVAKGMMVYESNGTGTITISQCPAAQGDKVSGSFNGVAVAAVDQSGATLTLDGTFEMGVATIASNELVCETTTTPDPTDTVEPGTCDIDIENECTGPCCPFIECVTTCMVSECMATCMGMDMEGCLACVATCETSTCASQMTSECQPKYEAYGACDEANGCSLKDSDEDEEQCIKDNCCDEAKAAFMP